MHRLYANIMTFYKGLDYLWILYGVEGPQEPNPQDTEGWWDRKIRKFRWKGKWKGGMDMSMLFSNVLFTMNTQIFFDFQWPLTTVSDNHSFPGLPPQPQSPDNTVEWILLSYKSSWNQPQRSSDLKSAISNILRTLQKFPWWPNLHACIIWWQSHYHGRQLLTAEHRCIYTSHSVNLIFSPQEKGNNAGKCLQKGLLDTVFGKQPLKQVNFKAATKSVTLWVCDISHSAVSDFLWPHGL